MAKLIPSLSSCAGRMQAGERRFATRLEQLLDEDYLCWFDMPVGKRQRYTDFIVFHPLRGLLLLEVKDWKLDTIESFDKSAVVLKTSSGLKNVLNPMEQARQCAYQLTNVLEADPELQQNMGQYSGKLAFPYGFGVVFTNITRKQFKEHKLGNIIPKGQVICRDEMLESCDPEVFQERLWNMFQYTFNTQLTQAQIDRVRWHIFPEVRIADQGSLFDNGEASIKNEGLDKQPLPDTMKVMDMQQEQLARSMGGGHRVIHGVAGSGKTLILLYRCEYLAPITQKPILVLCYNIVLASRLRELLTEKGLGDKVVVHHFHEWCSELLKRNGIEAPAYSGNEYFKQLEKQVAESVALGLIPCDRYGGIMVDEGHDFEPEWLSLISKMVDPEEGQLLLLYDDAQSIYSNKSQLGFSLSSVGIQARGRTSILRTNYRNTEEVFQFSYEFAKHYLTATDKGSESVPLIEPETAGRHSLVPELRRFGSFEREVNTIVTWLQRWHKERDIPWSDMCVLYRNKKQGQQIEAQLKASNIPHQWLATSKAKKAFNFTASTVKLMTIHSSKGLEFPMVVIAGLGYMPLKNVDIESEAKLLYVAMTRSTEKLLLTSHSETEFTKRLSPKKVAEPA
ncbi:DNA helicase II [Leucothrix sargassi]|nr:DNA helicase II [Leucothrix sargassi]